MPKLRRATAEEVRNYVGLYPLSHYVQVAGRALAVESLNGPHGDPKYEVMAPEGFHFKYEDLHSLLCFDMADLRERVGVVELEPCTDECR